jgi:Na+/proline symporter
VTLLYVGNSGLDQDTTQRLLACKDARAGSRALYLSVAATVPVTFIFIAIGQLLSIHYNRPDLVGSEGRHLASSFDGQQITVFMHYILTELPPGLRGLITVGVVAAAVATTNSALNAMSSVLVQGLYRPWRQRAGPVSEHHFVTAGRLGMAAMGLATFATAGLSFYWQRHTNMPLLEFALSVMTFAYAGLLGVYFTALMTRRGSGASAIAALVVGFLTVLLLQPYVIDLAGLPAGLKTLSFPWQLCIGAILAALTCLAGRPVNLPTSQSRGTHVHGIS